MSISEILRLKCQLDLMITSPWENVTNTQKKTSWFVNTKVYSPPHILVVVERRETVYENWVNCVSKAKRNKMLGEKNRDRPWIFFRGFYCSSNTSFFMWSVLSNVRPGSNYCLYIVVSHSQLTVFTLSCPIANSLSLHCRVPQPTHCFYLIASDHQLTLSCLLSTVL